MERVTLPSPRAGSWHRRLLAEGFCIIPAAVTQDTIGRVVADLEPDCAATPFCRGLFYGERTKRFGSLLRRSGGVQQLVMHPAILELAWAVLGEACDRMQLNVAQAIEIHPGERAQVPHRDHDMWQAEKGAHEFLLNVIWPLTPFTRTNGATVIYPRSHGAAGMARAELPEPMIAQCPPGSAICFLGSTAHGAGANRSSRPRRAIVVGYCLGWLKPYENQWLAYPPAIARSFPPELAQLAGYAQHRPNLGNFEGQCPSILLRGPCPEHLGAIDALRPDQEDMVRSFAGQAP